MTDIKVIFKEPGQPAESRRIPNTLKAFQELVGGCIEVVTIASNAVVVCNDEGRINGLPRNTLGICGNIVICGTKGDEFCDAPCDPAIFGR